MNVVVLKRLWLILRVLRQRRVLHLIFALLPQENRLLRIARRMLPHQLSQSNQATGAENLRAALETLGPIFIKFGQVLSTRPDLLPATYIDALSHLQDNISPVPTKIIRDKIEAQLGRPIDALFQTFSDTPVATASVAQVHQAVVAQGSWAGRLVAVKVLRPGIEQTIRADIASLYFLARQFAKRHIDGARLRPVEVVQQIEQHLNQELDLQCEAANTSVLRHQFDRSNAMFVPEVCWDYSASGVMVQEWMVGVPVSNTTRLKELGIDLQQLARDGVEVFFTQVFNHGFFHADMHPGNIFIGTQGEMRGHYIALDCGIVGSLSETDRHYLAINFLAFFNRDYRTVAKAHIDAGWVPSGTSLEALTSAVRTTCEPYFGRPIDEISLGAVLTRLFDVSRQFNVSVQPQLMLLQKTLLNIEGMGRILDPKLDLWVTAKPFLEKWMRRTLGPRGLIASLKKEWPLIVRLIPTAPREYLTWLHERSNQSAQRPSLLVAQSQIRATRSILVRWKIATFVILGVAALIILHSLHRHY